MPLSPAQLLILKNEFVNDPRGYGYAPFWTTGQDNALAQMINAPRNGTNPPSNPTAEGGNANGSIRVNLTSVESGEIRAGVTKGAYDALTTAERAWLNFFVSSGSIKVKPDNLQALAGIPTADGSIWATGNRVAMNAAMEAIMRKFGSRCEELFGTGVTVSVTDVTNSHNA